MTLVDTSVWVDHLSRGNDDLERLLETNSVMLHPFVLGELACGAIRRRQEVLGLLHRLPRAPLAEHEEVLSLIERYRLWNRGLGWVDIHLLASSILARTRLWTFDRALAKAVEGLEVG